VINLFHKTIIILLVVVIAGIVLLETSQAFKEDSETGLINSEASWRYKMTVIVDTPEGEKSGSAVREVTVRIIRQGVHPQTPRIEKDVSGEAVMVGLKDRGILFATMDTSGSYRIVFEAFPGPPGLTEEGMAYYKNLKNKKAVIEPGPLPDPLLVTFSDLTDPMSVKEVDPDNLQKTFGQGVSLKEIKIEMTEEPVTWRIKETLPWLERLEMKYLHGGSISGEGPLGIMHGGYLYRRGY